MPFPSLDEFFLHHLFHEVSLHEVVLFEKPPRTFRAIRNSRRLWRPPFSPFASEAPRAGSRGRAMASAEVARVMAEAASLVEETWKDLAGGVLPDLTAGTIPT